MLGVSSPGAVREAGRKPNRRVGLGLLVAAALAVTALAPSTTSAVARTGWSETSGVSLTAASTSLPAVPQISADPFTSSAKGQHSSEVEPAAAGYGRTVVAAFQVGKFSNGPGSAAIGWATSTDGGATWTHGVLPALTAASTPAGPYARAADPSVAFDAASGTWLIASVAVVPAGTGYTEGAIAVSRSVDGRTWGNPVVAVTAGQPDKSWVTCDNSTTSPHSGRCYLAWSADAAGYSIEVASSDDAGATWGSPVGGPEVGYYDVQPVVQPDGTVVVVATDTTDGSIQASRSTDGGASWSSPVPVAAVTAHQPAGGLRENVKPSATVADGRVYVAWTDCRFRPGCPGNDIVLSSSSDGVTWTPPTAVPLGDATATGDHFFPGLAADPAGAPTDRLGLVYYSYPVAACGTTGTPPCQLDVSAVDSADGGLSWNTPVRLNATPMSLSWLPSAYRGRMVGDYFGPAYANGNLVPVIAIAGPLRSTGPRYTQSMRAAVIGPNTVYAGDLAVTEGNSGKTTASVPVQLGSPQTSNVTITYTTSNGSATASRDYYGRSGTVIVPAGATSAIINLSVIGDTTIEPDEVFYVTLTTATSVTVADRRAVVTIANDD